MIQVNRHWRLAPLRLARDLNLLLRFRLTLLVALSAWVGSLLAGHPGGNLGVACSVALLCAGCGVLNQVQERDLDARMQRTAERPLASGRLRPRGGLLLALGFLGVGLTGLGVVGAVPFLLGAVAVFWYNGVYTPLKRRTALAVLPGAFCGAFPPLIGWTAAGSPPGHYVIVLLCGLLVLWQIPHFLLFVSRHRQDYLQAGLPVFSANIPAVHLRRILILWLAAVSIAALLLPAFGLLRQSLLQVLVTLCAVGLLVAAWRLGRRADWGGLFLRLNLFMGALLTSLACDRWLSGLPF